MFTHPYTFTYMYTHAHTHTCRLLRELVISMVLATDMSSHFDSVKEMKHILTATDA